MNRMSGTIPSAILRSSYAMSGTDVAYPATRCCALHPLVPLVATGTRLRTRYALLSVPTHPLGDARYWPSVRTYLPMLILC
eukprot:23752-Rhodomonas_salina.2